jgi:hypothetical protein
VQAGDTTGYERFRKEEIARFKSTGASSDVITATEAKIRSSLLRPADDETLGSLAPLAEVAGTPFPGKWDPQLLDFYDGWRSVSMGLLEFRRGNYAKAVDWTRHCLEIPETVPPRTADARIILAMSLHQLAQDDEARSELQQARNIIEARFSSPMDHGASDRGLWFDWFCARIFLQEATGLLTAAPAQMAAAAK